MRRGRFRLRRRRQRAPLAPPRHQPDNAKEHRAQTAGSRRSIVSVSEHSKSELEQELAEAMVRVLELEVSADEIDPDAALFGEGLGLDSIDALELSLEVNRRYGVEIKAEDERNEHIFASLRALASHVLDHRTK
nr:phosphopantetheine-binding protein [Rhodovibrio sodomensis]